MVVVKAARAACTSATCCSNLRTPRALIAISEPIATMVTATSASATSTSIMVKPSSERSVGDDVAWDNLDPPCQPVHTNFITGIKAGKRDRAAARRAVGKKADGRQRR